MVKRISFPIIPIKQQFYEICEQIKLIMMLTLTILLFLHGLNIIQLFHHD